MLGLIRSAAGGTLFLDEIGEMSPEAQTKLLRFLESGEVFPLGESRPHFVDVRIVAATNANLDQLVTEGRFRKDLSGNYSEYGNLTSSTWLRGIQPVDANGVARFTTIYPGWYAGRATHIHIEVFVNNRSVKTTQLAFPEEINSAVYSSGVYASKGQNPTKASNDMVFSDGVTSELASVAGNTASGYAATFTVGVAL